MLMGEHGGPEQAPLRLPQWLTIAPADWRSLVTDLDTKREELHQQAETIS